MILSHRFALLAGTSLVALALPAFAQNTDISSGVVLDEVVLDATAPTQGYVVPTSQIATKTDAPVLETQQSVSVITRQQFEDQGAQNMSQALRYTTGVTAEPYGADPRFDQPNLRGFSASNSQYLNGLHLVRKFGAMPVELYGLERVEVLRGPSSGLYGAGAPGGLINMVQKHAQFEDFNEAGLGFGTNDQSLFFDMNRAASDSMAWRLTGILNDTQEQIEELENKRGYLAGAFRWELDDVSTLDVMLSYQKDSPISVPGIPIELTEIADDDYAREFYAGYPDTDDSDRKLLNFGVEYSRELDNGWELKQGFRYQKLDWDYTGFYANGMSEDLNQVNVGYIFQSEDSSTLNIDTRLLGEANTGAVAHKLLFGMDISRWDGESSTQFGNAPALDWRNPDYDVAVPAASWYFSSEDVTMDQVGIYAQDEMSWGNWRATLALRHDWTNQNGTSENNYVGKSTVDQSDEATTGRAGISYVFANGFAPYLAYSTSFEPEIGTDRGGNTYDPTEGKQWELGAKYQPTNMNALFTAAVYDLKQTNVKRPVEFGFYEQIGEVHTRGVELEATAELAEGWDIRAAYTYTDARQEGGSFDGQRMPNTPYNSASMWLQRDFGNGVKLGGGLRYIGERYGDEGNNIKIDSVTLGDLGASYTRDNVVASLNVSNITDEEYLVSCGLTSCYYGEGREVQARVTYKW